MKMLRIYLSIDVKLDMPSKFNENLIVTTPVLDISDIHTSKSKLRSSLFTTLDLVVVLKKKSLLISEVSFKVSLATSYLITKILKL